MLAFFKHALEKRYIKMIAELVAVGTEILLGNIVNTNSAYLSEKCAQLGLSVYYESCLLYTSQH